MLYLPGPTANTSDIKLRAQNVAIHGRVLFDVLCTRMPFEKRREIRCNYLISKLNRGQFVLGHAADKKKKIPIENNTPTKPFSSLSSGGVEISVTYTMCNI